MQTLGVKLDPKRFFGYQLICVGVMLWLGLMHNALCRGHATHEAPT